MGNWYVKGGSTYNDPEYCMYAYCEHSGYDEALYPYRAIQIDGSTYDPYWALGLDTNTMTSGIQRAEIGLLNDHRLVFTTSGIFGWTAVSGWQGVMGQGDNLGNHIATGDLDMNGNAIIDAGGVVIKPTTNGLTIYENGGVADYIRISHNSTDGYFEANVGGFRFKPQANGLIIYENAGATDYIQIYHNGTNANITTNAGDLYILDHVRIRSGNYLTVYDSGNTDYMNIYHNSSNGIIATNVGGVLVYPQANGFYVYENNATTDWVRIYHDGSNGYITTNAGDLYLNPTGDVRSSKKIYNAVWNDYADFIPLAKGEEKVPGMCYYETGKGLAICNKRNQLGAFGICSDTYGYATGNQHRAVPISVAGIVLAYVDKVYKSGTLLINNKRGILTKASKRERYNALAMYMRECKKIKTKGVYVNGRHWVKVK
jgi:hypothetical protein